MAALDLLDEIERMGQQRGPAAAHPAEEDEEAEIGEEHGFLLERRPALSDADIAALNLNVGQAALIERAYGAVAGRERGVLLFVDGGPGVGKTYAVRILAARVVRRFGHKAVRNVAFQGRVAQMLRSEGNTLSSAFGFGHGKADYTRLGQNIGKMRAEFDGLRMLLIDEVGFVAAQMLCWVDRRMRSIFSCDAAVWRRRRRVRRGLLANPAGERHNAPQGGAEMRH